MITTHNWICKSKEKRISESVPQRNRGDTSGRGDSGKPRAFPRHHALCIPSIQLSLTYILSSSTDHPAASWLFLSSVSCSNKLTELQDSITETSNLELIRSRDDDLDLWWVGVGDWYSLMKLSPRPWHVTLSPGSVKLYLNCETLSWCWRAI